MYGKIIVGFNDSDESRDALALAKLIAETTGGQLVVTGVFPCGPSGQFASAAVLKAAHEAEIELAERAGREDRAGSKGRGSGGRGLSEQFPRPRPARRDRGARRGSVVVGSSSRAGVGRILAGNVALQLLHGSPCAVAVAPKGFRESDSRLRAIAVGITDSEESREALRAAVELAKASQATLRLLTAVNASAADEFGWGYGQHNWAPTLRRAMEETLQEAAGEVPDELRPATELLDGDVVPSLVSEAENGVDLLFVGSRGYGPVRRVLLGSVSGALTVFLTGCVHSTWDDEHGRGAVRRCPRRSRGSRPAARAREAKGRC